MKSDFFARRALLILCVIFFLIPFALRGARMSLERVENNVKDWLPDSFEETTELRWFAKHFVGEQSFVLLTWEGCSETDESYKVFVDKLRTEIQPSETQLPAEDLAAEGPPSDEAKDSGEKAEVKTELTDHQQRETERADEIERARRFGDEYRLYTTGDFHRNWGNLDEKWLKGADQSWYYITPNGELYQWHGRSNVLGAIGRLFKRNVLRDKSLNGTHVATFGRPPSKKYKNDFHNDPRKLTARVLQSVTTGPDVLAELSAPGGSMWPRGTQYSEEERAVIARRRALDRLKGSLYGPEPYEDFRWTADDMSRVLRPAKMAELPDGWIETLDTFVDTLVREQYKGEESELLSDSLIRKEQHWNALFAAMGVEPPGLQTCVMVTLSSAGTEDLRRVIGRGLLGKPLGKLVKLAEESGIRAPSKPPMLPLAKHELAGGKVLRMGGPPVDNTAIDEEGQITLVRLIGFSAVLGIALAYLCFRRVTITVMVLIVGGASAIASLSFVWWTGESVDAILLSMPALVYVLGLSGAVHIVNYYREAVQEHGTVGAPRRALSHGMIPCTLAAFTTSLGLLSLCQSNIAPIRKFGLYSAIGVMATLVLLFTYLPSALQLWPPGYDRERRSDRETGMRHKVHMMWQSIGDWVIAHHWWVTAGAAVLLIGFGIGLTKINTSIQLLKLFDEEAKIIRDYEWLEQEVGKIVPMELVVRVDPEVQYPTADQRSEAPAPTAEQRDNEQYQYSFIERIEMVAHIQDAVEQVFGDQGQGIVGRALSAATFTPPILDPLNAERGPTNLNLEENRDRLLKENYLSVDDDASELWRISVRLGALNDVDYGLFVSQLKRVVEPVVRAYDYRDVVLRAVAKTRSGDEEDSHPWNDTAIAVLGASNPRARSVVTPAVHDVVSQETTKKNALTDSMEKTDEELGVDRVFAGVLGDLLRAKGFQGPKRRGRTLMKPKRYLAWHNSHKKPLPEGRARSDEWVKYLSQFDCVVVVRDHPDYDLEFIKRHVTHVVDARHHGFDALVDQTAKQLNKPIEVTYTGIVPIVYKTQRTLLRSLIDSIGWAFVMIAAVMFVLLRNKRSQLLNIRGGLVSMVPNVFPVILIFGFMGHRGVIVDIGTMMTASVAMGVAVDDTIHFLTWFRIGIRNGLKRNAAIKEAYSRVALAMTQTTFIGGLGLSIFSVSTFTPTQRFGTMMLTLLFAALVGDLILLPALLAGPLGKYLCPKVDPSATEPVPDAVEESDAGQGDAPDVLPIGTAGARQRAPLQPPARDGRSASSSVIRRDNTHT